MGERPAVAERWSSALASYYMVDIIGLAGFLLLTPRMIAHFGATQYGVLALAAGLTGYLGLLDLGIKPALTRMVGAAWAVGERSRVEALLRHRLVEALSNTDYLGAQACDHQLLLAGNVVVVPAQVGGERLHLSGQAWRSVACSTDFVQHVAERSHERIC